MARRSRPRSARISRTRALLEDAAALEQTARAVHAQLVERVELRQKLQLMRHEFREHGRWLEALVAQLRAQHEALCTEAELALAATAECSRQASAQLAQHRRVRQGIHHARAQLAEQEQRGHDLAEEIQLEERGAEAMERLVGMLDARLRERSALQQAVQARLVERSQRASQLQREVLAIRGQLESLA